MKSTHHELSFELLHVGWHSNLQIFTFSLVSQTRLSWSSLTQQLADGATPVDLKLSANEREPYTQYGLSED